MIKKILSLILATVFLTFVFATNISAAKPPSFTIETVQAPTSIAIDKEASFTLYAKHNSTVNWRIEPSFGSIINLVESETPDNYPQISFDYTSSQAGDATITVTATDMNRRNKKATLSLPISVLAPTNAPPTIVSVTAINIDEDTSLTGGQVEITDPDYDTVFLTASSTNVKDIELKPSADNTKMIYTFTYTPATDFNGSESITFIASDDYATDTYDIEAIVNPIDDPSIPLGDSATTVVNESVTIDILSNDNDIDEPLDVVHIITSNSDPFIQSNALSVNYETGTGVSYVPEVDFIGTDTFGYKMYNAETDTYSAIVLVTVEVTEDINVLDKYVALGDSIATGTTGSVFDDTTPYTHMLYSYLEGLDSNIDVTFIDYATPDTNLDGDLDGRPDGDGMTSSGLLDFLNTPSVYSDLLDADVVTISIGGNNLMQAAEDPDAPGGYDFYNIDQTKAELGRAQFEGDWTQITAKFDAIKLANPDVQIIVNTTYNPYNSNEKDLDGFNYSNHDVMNWYLYGYTDTLGIYKEGINNIIKDSAGSYVVADVGAAFYEAAKDKMGDYTYFYPSNWFWRLMRIRDPHPNQAGQNFILEVVKDELM